MGKKGEGVKQEAVIASCSCAHAFQDKRYGKGMRVHSPLGPTRKDRSATMRCSVCGVKR